MAYSNDRIIDSSVRQHAKIAADASPLLRCYQALGRNVREVAIPIPQYNVVALSGRIPSLPAFEHVLSAVERRGPGTKQEYFTIVAPNALQGYAQYMGACASTGARHTP